ncbi:prolyl oligopeptidase family serine peptidase [Leptospira levettii]|uniref:alpha/beta hydrolase family esterase n=1 Tax=Leptospira levettii TaxID=2023178 RepID=UPI00223E3114|nr:prolyl oligopeptidase family serine peptidase [Leptospira levettii]MCW7497684.1 prolyl oligopeptidase family serine peptidase [Leptospira levettii]
MPFRKRLHSIIFISICVFAMTSCERGYIRSALKEKFQKKISDLPAPNAITNLAEPITNPGDYVFSTIHQEMLCYYKIHVPKSYHPNSSVPLLFVFHGGGGDMEIQSKEEFYHQISKSEELGHIVVFPNGYSLYQSGKFATWNAGNCCGESKKANVDDLGFVKGILSHLTQQMNIDKKRIYSTGMSNGAMMSYQIACSMADQFAGITAVAGTDNTIDCKPSKPISIFHIHAKNDDKVLFYGGAGSSFPDRSLITDFVSVPKTVSKWVQLNVCNPTPKIVLQNKDVTCEEYHECKDGVTVKLCVTEDGGHSWPGGKKPSFLLGGGSPTKAIIANDVMWDFFRSHSK